MTASSIIAKPDKGNGVVIVSRLDYLNKMKQLISDNTKFKQLKQNPTKSSISAYLRKLSNEKIIDDATFHKILPRGSSPGVLYGLPKVHKASCPLRPIVSSFNTYNYNLASYLVGVFQPISTNQHSVKDSFNFADWAKKYKHNNEIMCSLDVSLMYRYVDDTFTMFENKDTANGFLQYLNCRHNSIKFTIEFEQDNEIPFLDILVKRCPSSTFVTSIYRKKTFTDLYTKWDSFTPRKYKIILIRTLTYRCYRICSSASLFLAAILWRSSKASASKWLPPRDNHLQR